MVCGKKFDTESLTHFSPHKYVYFHAEGTAGKCLRRLFLCIGQLTEAVFLYRKILARDPKNADA